jgi:rhamnulose-1-phosphate aldolase
MGSMERMRSRRTINSVVKDISEVAGYLWERGWAEGNAGNLSVDITDIVPKTMASLSRAAIEPERIYAKELAGRNFYMTIAGSRFRDVARSPEENLLIIRIARDLRGYHILGGGKETGKKPSSELATHFRIHGFLRENELPQKAVLHTHPPQLIALTHLKPYGSEKAVNRMLREMLPEVELVLPEGVGLAPYRHPRSPALAEVTVRSLKRHRVVLWEKHGCTAIGMDVFEAFDLIDTVNKAAGIFFLCRMAGEVKKGER